MKLILLLLISTNYCYAEPLGRLFFTPEQRTEPSESTTQQHTHISQQETPSNYPPVTVNGIIQKQNSDRHVWVNGQHYQLLADEATHSVDIQLPNSMQTIQLEVGQTLIP